jgi:hypothetical protein
MNRGGRGLSCLKGTRQHIAHPAVGKRNDVHIKLPGTERLAMTISGMYMRTASEDLSEFV